MDLPLTQRTLFGSGKTHELADLCQSTKATHLLVYNSLTEAQKHNLADLTGSVVVSFLDEPDILQKPIQNTPRRQDAMT